MSGLLFAQDFSACDKIPYQYRKDIIIHSKSTMFTTSSLETIIKWSLRLDSTATTSSGSRAFKVAVERANDQLISQTDPHPPETAPFEVSILAGGTQYIN